MTAGGEPTQDPPDLRLVAPALATWLAALVAWELRGPRQVFALAAVLLLGAAASALRSPSVAVVMAAALVCAAAGVVGVATRAAALHGGPVADLAARRAVVTSTAVIATDPELRSGRIRFGRAVPLVVVRARLERVESAGSALRVRAPVLVLATGPAWLRLLPGTKVRLEGRLLPPRGSDPLAAVVVARGSPYVVSPAPLYQRVAGRLRVPCTRRSTGFPAPPPGCCRGSCSATPRAWTPRSAPTSGRPGSAT